MGATKIREEEVRKIMQMHEWGLADQQIAEIVGRDRTSVRYITTGRWEQKKEYFRAQNAKRRAARAALEQPEEAPEEQQEELPEEAPEQVQEQPEWAKDERLMMRIADSTDYTNALLNGILKRLMDICDALGVGNGN